MARRRHRLVPAVAGLAALLVAAACSSSAEPAERSATNVLAEVDQSAAVEQGPVGENLPLTPTVQRIRERGSLVAAGVLSSPVFALQDPATGRISGFDAGIAQLLAKYILGEPNVETKTSGAETRESLLQNGSVDVVVSTYSITEARDRLIDFSTPYYIAQSGIVVRSDETRIEDAGDLAGMKVATQPGAAEEALRRGIPEAEPILFETSSECLEALRQGRVDAWSQNNASLLSKIVQETDVMLLPATYGTVEFGIGMSEDDPEFKEIVDEFVRTIVADGTWQRLWDDTVGVVQDEPPVLPTPGSP
ncbi:transporter substrate-binding domain-containing protein [Jiangella anatolica]|uniref:Solute-binding protein family 3/N-terminal domain-containing protein n=1 Tax=Jiangella anatolica TaxID=2670374 RepID=A0A2W2BNM9_9ACTN|nr:transporter substrate-binding domain-containing protein [Jiangella anatolica]PZF81934.1 hypothetical protein C1I92_19100 [Jiangella anatolica]